MYPYSEVNRFKNTNSYMYTPFYGIDFIHSYFENRSIALINLKKKLPEVLDFNDQDIILCKTCEELKSILLLLNIGDTEAVWPKLDLYVKRFEVAKKLRTEYPVKSIDDIASIEVHLLFFHILIKAYGSSSDIRYLNVLLKLSDSLVSVIDIIHGRKNIRLLMFLLTKEQLIIKRLAREMGVDF